MVTGSGPHSGDAFASSRFDFDLETIASIHAKSIWIFCVLLGWFGFREIKSQTSKTRKSFYLLLLVVFVQGLIGYVQFAQGVPELLVFVHIIGATIFWVAALRLRSDLMQDKRV
jgi:cytochrome c oxidase assembly protein subunit 15